MRYLTIRKFSSESGYSEAAIRSKIADGTWRKDYLWRKAADGRVLIDAVEQSLKTRKPKAVNVIPFVGADARVTR